MAEEAWELTKCEGPSGGKPCGYMFIKAIEGAKRCNDCGANERQPRVCRVGGEATDWKTLLGLAHYTLGWMGEPMSDSISSVAQGMIDDALEAGEPSE